MTMAQNRSFNSSWLSPFVIPKEFLLPEPLSTGVIITLMVLYILIIVFAIFGNSLVIIIIGVIKKCRSVTDIYILSLAVSDLMIATLNMPFHVYYIVANEWISADNTGEIFCKLTSYIQGVTIVSSIFTLLVIAIDRYVVICNSTRISNRIHNKKSAYISLAILWVVTLLLLTPHLVFQKLDKLLKVKKYGDIFLFDGFGCICAEVYSNKSISMVYTAFTYGCLYLLPVLIMAFCYGKMVHRLWIRPSIGEILENPLHHQRNVIPRKRIIKIMVLVFLAFALLWLPFFTFSFYAEFEQSDGYTNRIQLAILKLIGYSNCCVNPIIYTFLNRNFQNEFIKMFCKNRVITLSSEGNNTDSVRKSRF